MRLHPITDELHHEWHSRARNAYWNHNNRNVNSNVNNSNNQNDNLGSRGVIGVYWLCEDLSHPPSILPISSTCDWSWKTRVSFTSFFSRRRRIFRFNTSKVPLAFRRIAAFMGLGAFLVITSSSRSVRILASMLVPRLKRHRFMRWSFTSVNCLYSS